MPNASQALTALLNPSLDVTDDKPKNTTSITLKNSNDALIRSIFKIKTKDKDTLFNTDEKILELQKAIDKITDKEFKTECIKLKKSLQNLISHIKKIKKQKRINSTVKHLDQLAYELCCDTLYYAEKGDYFNFINTTSRRSERYLLSIEKPRKFQGLRYVLHVITEAFKYLFLIGFYLAYKRGGFSKTTTSDKINQFLKQRIKFYVNNDYKDPSQFPSSFENIYSNCYQVPNPNVPVIDRLQKLRYKKIMFDELYFSEKPALETFLTTITLLRWTQVKELYFNYPINLLINKQINALMHAIQKSAVRVLSLDNAKGGWNIADINAFTMGLIGSEITTLDLKIKIGAWQRNAILAFTKGLQQTPVTSLILQKNNLEEWDQGLCLTFARGLVNTNVSKLDLSLNNIHRWAPKQIQAFIEELEDSPVHFIKLGSIRLWSVDQLLELMTGLQKTNINTLEIDGEFNREQLEVFLTLLPMTKITNLKGQFWLRMIESVPYSASCLEKTKIQINLSDISWRSQSKDRVSERIYKLFHNIQTSQTNSLTLHDTEFYKSSPDYNNELIRYATYTYIIMTYVVDALHKTKINEINMFYDNTPITSNWLTALKLRINLDEEKKPDQDTFIKEYTLNLSGSNLASIDHRDSLEALIDGLKDDPANKLKCCIGTLDLSNTNLNKFSYTPTSKHLAIALATTNVHTVILNDNDLTQNELKMFKWHLGKKQLSTFLLGNLENKEEPGKPKPPDSAIRTNFIKKEERAALHCINYCDQFSEVKTAAETNHSVMYRAR